MKMRLSAHVEKHPDAVAARMREIHGEIDEVLGEGRTEYSDPRVREMISRVRYYLQSLGLDEHELAEMEESILVTHNQNGVLGWLAPHNEISVDPMVTNINHEIPEKHIYAHEAGHSFAKNNIYLGKKVVAQKNGLSTRIHGDGPAYGIVLNEAIMNEIAHRVTGRISVMHEKSTDFLNEIMAQIAKSESGTPQGVLTSSDDVWKSLITSYARGWQKDLKMAIRRCYGPYGLALLLEIPTDYRNGGDKRFYQALQSIAARFLANPPKGESDKEEFGRQALRETRLINGRKRK